MIGTMNTLLHTAAICITPRLNVAFIVKGCESLGTLDKRDANVSKLPFVHYTAVSIARPVTVNRWYETQKRIHKRAA